MVTLLEKNVGKKTLFKRNQDSKGANDSNYVPGDSDKMFKQAVEQAWLKGEFLKVWMTGDLGWIWWDSKCFIVPNFP